MIVIVLVLVIVIMILIVLHGVFCGEGQHLKELVDDLPLLAGIPLV